ncbi:MAG: hypothetical protein HOH43_03910 [Candidatus Latescibacteria bacterium]|jgi:hypothetical protein|nr:hypothetical protein [Candidatus Latescibacterota bacterium]
MTFLRRGALLLLLFTALNAQAADMNVLSYYAVGNSLDGQPVIDRVNVLRFFPVFAMKDRVTEVEVTVYVGGRIYTRRADKLEEARYWEVLLPTFELGQAIQRLEVEMRFELKAIDQERADAIRQAEETKKDKVHKDFARLIKTINYAFEQKYALTSSQTDRLRRAWEDGPKEYDLKFDELLPPSARNDASEKATLDSLVTLRSTALRDYSPALTQIDSLRTDFELRLYTDLSRSLSDTLYAGPGVRPSDLVVNYENGSARILYRNYKTALRQMPALDPAEQRGIFRVRYVPFPIAGRKSRSDLTLVNPFDPSSPAVFEIGLAFGNQIVPGDDFVLPGFSFRRFGIAIGITEKLFASDAEIIALALTYDFNSYGSLGAGANFAQDEVHGYGSLGVNKKAFEALLSGLVSIFQ